MGLNCCNVAAQQPLLQTQRLINTLAVILLKIKQFKGQNDHRCFIKEEPQTLLCPPQVSPHPDFSMG